MVKDADISAKRSFSGKTGGINTQKKNKLPIKKFAKAKSEANTGIGIVYVNEDENVLKMPFTSNFISYWNGWKKYKKVDLKFQYKSIESEQASLDELVKKSNNDELTAILILKQSMANGWKGFFELKQPQNGTTKLGTSEAREVSLKNWGT